MEGKNVLDCGHEPSPHLDCTTGYGVTEDGKKHCYECCADRDRESMKANGRITLYLTDITARPDSLRIKNCRISNWPGSLVILGTCQETKNGHNWGLTRRDVWFCGPDGKPWYGVQYGDNTQLVHCRRTKA